mgnify:CR=1 FL=1
MKAFHNDVEVQNKYLTRIRNHAKADEFVKGQYWRNGKGCAVGCTVHSSHHAAYETELGIPEWVARLEDRIFEGLPNSRAKLWPVEFLEAVHLGANLDSIKIPMLIFICEAAREKTDNKLAHDYIDGVLTELKKDKLDLIALQKAKLRRPPRYYAAAYAADAAADAADAAADAAAHADAAAYAAAAYAAYAAAAYAAADAAADADAADADAAEYETEYVKFADKLLELIKGCK